MSQNFKLQNDELISVGNVCLILDTSRDYFNYLHVNNPKAKEIVLEHMISYNIVDIYMYVYREFHPNDKRYTWRTPTHLKQARLGFFLVSVYL